LEAHLTGRDGRRLQVEANMTDPEGQRVLTSTALFVLVDVAHFATAYARTLESAMSSAITKTTDETGGPTGVPGEPRP